jgi:tetratricopeptide (TPR) repeat protein
LPTDSSPAVMAADAVYNAALDLIANHDLTAAAQWLAQAVELYDHHLLWELLGLCRFSLGEYACAQQSWYRSVACGGADGQAHRYLNALTTPDFVEFAARFNASLNQALRQKFLSALLNLWPTLETVTNLAGKNLAGLLLYRLGLKKSAARLWKEVLRLDRSNRRAAAYLADGKPGFIPYWIEIIIWEALWICGKISDIMKFSA